MLKTDNPIINVIKFSCNNSHGSNFTETFWNSIWWYLIAKVIELFDTVFFVLRKKQNQVSFLHVYHHSIMVFFTWCYLKYLPGNTNT